MRTALVSDLHLGSLRGGDLLRDRWAQEVLLGEIGAADRVVLLGDVLELFELPLPVVLESARPFFEALGEAMAGRPVVLVPGNHDHRLAEPLLERVAIAGRPLALEQRAPATGKPSELLAAWLGQAELEIAYPGIWLREDVYATHGHYMDCHRRLPRLECVAAATSIRLLGPLPQRPSPDDYERLLWPVYGLAFALAQAGLATRVTRPSERIWRAASHRPAGKNRHARRALRRAVPLGIRVLNRALRSDFSPDLSRAAISSAGVQATTRLAERLRIGATHTIVGHTHDAALGGQAPRLLPGGGLLHNTGSWVLPGAPPRPAGEAGWPLPGTVTWVAASGAPRRVELLAGRSLEELRTTRPGPPSPRARPS